MSLNLNGEATEQYGTQQSSWMQKWHNIGEVRFKRDQRTLSLPAPAPYYKRDGQRTTFPHQRSLSIRFLDQVTNFASSTAEVFQRHNALPILLKLVMGEQTPIQWERGFQTIPEWCYVPVIALRYILMKDPRMMVDGYLDALLATIAALAELRTVTETSCPKIDRCDRTESDGDLIVDERSITFASYFMAAVDHVIFLNDVVGGVLGPSSLNPCHYFDANVFHTKLATRQLSTTGRRDYGSTGRLERLLCDDHRKIALYLKLRSAALAGLSEGDLNMDILDAELTTVQKLTDLGLIAMPGQGVPAPRGGFR